jgi:hypothetical protein
VAVEKLHFLQNSRNLGDRKCLGKSRKSFVGHPDAILFFANFLRRSFSIATGHYTQNHRCRVNEYNGDFATVIAAFMTCPLAMRPPVSANGSSIQAKRPEIGFTLHREHGKLAEVPAVGGWSEFRQDLWLTKV